MATLRVRRNNRRGTLRLGSLIHHRVTLDFVDLWQHRMKTPVVALRNRSLLLFHANCAFTRHRNNCVQHHIHLVPGNPPTLHIKGARQIVRTDRFKTGRALYAHVVRNYDHLLRQTD